MWQVHKIKTYPGKPKKAYQELLVDNEAYDEHVDGDESEGGKDDANDSVYHHHQGISLHRSEILPPPANSVRSGAVRGKSPRSMPRWSRADSGSCGGSGSSDGTGLLTAVDGEQEDDFVFDRTMLDFAEPDQILVDKAFDYVDLSSDALLASIDE